MVSSRKGEAGMSALHGRETVWVSHCCCSSNLLQTQMTPGEGPLWLPRPECACEFIIANLYKTGPHWLTHQSIMVFTDYHWHLLMGCFLLASSKVFLQNMTACFKSDLCLLVWNTDSLLPPPLPSSLLCFFVSLHLDALWQSCIISEVELYTSK